MLSASAIDFWNDYGVVLGILPLATSLAAVLISEERPSLGFWLSSVAGSMVVVGCTLWTGTREIQLGDPALLGAVRSAAIGYAVGGRLAKEMSGGPVICWALVFSMPLTVVPAWIVAPASFAAIPSDAWVGFLYLALVSQLLGFFLCNAGLAIGGIARVSQAQLIQPFVTIVASALLLGERLEESTMQPEIFVVRAFADGPFSDNPAAVCLLVTELP